MKCRAGGVTFHNQYLAVRFADGMVAAGYSRTTLEPLGTVRKDELQSVQFPGMIPDRNHERVPQLLDTVRLDPLGFQVRMFRIDIPALVPKSCRVLPTLSPDCLFYYGCLFFCLFHPDQEICLFFRTPGRFSLPGFGKAGTPATKHTTCAVLKQFAPTSLIIFRLLVANLTNLPGAISTYEGAPPVVCRIASRKVSIATMSPLFRLTFDKRPDIGNPPSGCPWTKLYRFWVAA